MVYGFRKCDIRTCSHCIVYAEFVRLRNTQDFKKSLKSAYIEIKFVPGGKHCTPITRTGIWWCYGTECYLLTNCAEDAVCGWNAEGAYVVYSVIILHPTQSFLTMGRIHILTVKTV